MSKAWIPSSDRLRRQAVVENTDSGGERERLDGSISYILAKLGVQHQYPELQCSHSEGYDSESNSTVYDSEKIRCGCVPICEEDGRVDIGQFLRERSKENLAKDVGLKNRMNDQQHFRRLVMCYAQTRQYRMGGHNVGPWINQHARRVTTESVENLGLAWKSGGRTSGVRAATV
ncbi:hypothetical protein F5887DRAFT_924715 [Amanita rubescens]|nr:hypothetical protein F5887DRAFT_924715 [Amanita rubescens]